MGDLPRFATISPRSGARNGAVLELQLDRARKLLFEVTNRNGVGERMISSELVQLSRGRNRIPWQPKATSLPGTYILRVREPPPAGSVLGHAVVRVLDVEACFG